MAIQRSPLGVPEVTGGQSRKDLGARQSITSGYPQDPGSNLLHGPEGGGAPTRWRELVPQGLTTRPSSGPTMKEIEDLACDSKSKDSWHAR